MYFFRKKGALGTDVELLKRYFRSFRYIGIFPFCGKEALFHIRLFSKCLTFLLLILFLVGVIFIYLLKTDIIYSNMELPQIIVDVVEHLAEHFSILAILSGAIRDSETWELNFDGLMQIDGLLTSKRSYVLFYPGVHVLKLIGYPLVSFLISATSIYYYWGNIILYSNIIHRLSLLYIIITVVFFVTLINIIKRRYICLNIEVTKICSTSKNILDEQLVENEIKHIKFLHITLYDITKRVDTKFGPQIIFIISFLLLDLLNIFNWFLFDFYKDTADLGLTIWIIDLILDPFTYIVSNASEKINFIYNTVGWYDFHKCE